MEETAELQDMPVDREPESQTGPRRMVTSQQPEMVRMSPDEVTYLLQLEEQNRRLTLDLGDALLVLDAKKAVLSHHRKILHEAYTSALRVRGIKNGSFDTEAGVIRVAERHPPGE